MGSRNITTAPRRPRLPGAHPPPPQRSLGRRQVHAGPCPRRRTRPGTLVCDIDELRSWVSGWDEDFIGTGEAVRSRALALITAYLRTGRDVVLPQLIVTPAQIDRFEAAAAEAGASYVGVVLSLAPEMLLDRLHARAETPVTAVISRIIEERGGDASSLRGAASSCSSWPRSAAWTVVDATDQDARCAALDELHPVSD